MKTALFCVLALLLVSLATAQTPRDTKPDRTSAEAYIRESEAQWAESVASGDPKAIERILADDFIGTDPKGNLYDKATMIADTKTRRNILSRIISTRSRLGSLAIQPWRREASHGNVVMASAVDLFGRIHGLAEMVAGKLSRRKT